MPRLHGARQPYSLFGSFDIRSSRSCISFIWRRRSSMLPSSAAGSGTFSGSSGSRHSGARRHERLEHREGLLKHFHVAADMLFQRRERRAAESVGQLLAEFFLLARQRVDRLFEIFRHHHLHAVAVEPDQLAQEGGRQQILAGLVFLFEDDLRQHRAGDVVAGLGVIDEEILAIFHHRSEIFERHIGAGTGIIEPPIGVFLDRGGLVSFRHGLTQYTPRTGTRRHRRRAYEQRIAAK